MFDKISRTFSLRGEEREKYKELFGNLDGSPENNGLKIEGLDGGVDDEALNAEEAASIVSDMPSALDMLIDSENMGQEDDFEEPADETTDSVNSDNSGLDFSSIDFSDENTESTSVEDGTFSNDDVVFEDEDD